MRRDWRAPLVLATGLGNALAVGVGWELAATRAGEGLDPELARLAFDLGNLSFATAWVALGGFTVVTGWPPRARVEHQPRQGVLAGVAVGPSAVR
ncbi:hypothetical protein ACTMTJ_32255 [Phytohabitans sp. LJ34]|uniref:hypothetical protein n=1 Tax=Phytohabitans sp. LJ34 TaxID=3452217 RepID=UPI003F88CDEA